MVVTLAFYFYFFFHALKMTKVVSQKQKLVSATELTTVKRRI